MTDEPKIPEDGEEPHKPDPPKREQSTEEQFAIEAGVNPPTEDIPALDPEFADALRAAGRKDGEGDDPEEAEGTVHPPPAPADPGETIEYAPGDAPDQEPYTGDQPLIPANVAGAVADPSLQKTQIIRAGRDEARDAIAQAAETGEPWAPKRPPVTGDPEPPPKRKRLWIRYVAASFIVILSFASATTAIGVMRLNRIVDEITQIPQELNLPEYKGGAQTFLILGSDRRAADGPDAQGLSDTTILLHVDPVSDPPRISVLNIPRDLKVDIPNYGVNKFNAAYSFGGPKLTLETIRQITRTADRPHGVQINHVVNIDFLGFAQAINAINCVYVDVDRRYYHSNEGVPASEQYSEINIQPGYQRLCGADGLAYVRYRHTDTDLVRAARQQDFLREARQRVPISKLVTDRDSLIDIFAEHTTSDIDSPSQLIDVVKLMIGARNASIKEIHFPATLGPSYVYATRDDIAGAIDQFIQGKASGGPRGTLEGGEPQRDDQGSGATGATGATGDKSSKDKDKKKKKSKPDEEKAPPTPTAESDGLVDASTSGLEEAKKAARKSGAGFPIYYPTRVPPDSQYDDEEYLSSNPWVYHVQDTSGDVHQAYKTVLEQFADDGTHYFGVQGLNDWDDPPALDDPSEEREIGKLDTEIFLDGDRVRSISWHDGGNTYWLSNDLLQTLTNDQMLGMVRSMRSIDPNVKHHAKKKKNKK